MFAHNLHHRRNQATQCVPLSNQDLVILVTNSNVHHELVNNEYGQRRATCESVCQKLKKAFLRDVAMEELEGGRASLYVWVVVGVEGDTTLQPSIPPLPSLLPANRGILTDIEFCRARHVVGEIRRTFCAVEALKSGDYIRFGQLMNESHDSLR